MPQAIIYLDETLDKKIKDYSIYLNLSKHETILKILRDYKCKEVK